MGLEMGLQVATGINTLFGSLSEAKKDFSSLLDLVLVLIVLNVLPLTDGSIPATSADVCQRVLGLC